jgi:hypothetical protein
MQESRFSILRSDKKIASKTRAIHIMPVCELVKEVADVAVHRH